MSKYKNKQAGHGAPKRHEQKTETVPPAATNAGQPPIKAAGNDGVKPKSIEKAKDIMKEIQKMQKDLDENFVNFLKGLPSMIMQNGLGQTVAFLQTKDKKEQKVADMLDRLLLLTVDDQSKKLMDRILDDNVENYTLRQREAIEYAGWMKKFAVAFRKSASSANEEKEREKDG